MENKADYRTVDEYIALFPEATQAILRRVRAVVKEAAPTAVERIAYRMPTYTMGANLIHFAAYARHIGLYPTPNGVQAFEAELSSYKRAKGSVQFPLDGEIPYDLIGRIVRYRVERAAKDAAAKAPKRRKA